MSFAPFVDCALICDGPSDGALEPILLWSLRRLRPSIRIVGPRRYVRGPRPVEEAVRKIQDTYAPTILFVHRDAERVSVLERRAEIPKEERIVAVIPVRMTEAWLLVDERALRLAANNPNGRQELAIPRLRDLENLPDPKRVLQDLLLEASGLQGRRRRSFDFSAARQRLAGSIDDYSPLHKLTAFETFWEELSRALNAVAPG